MNDVWKWVSGVLAAILVSVVTTAWAFGWTNAVSAAEVSEMIRQQSPYTQDRTYIINTLGRVEAQLTTISELQLELVQNIAAITGR